MSSLDRVLEIMTYVRKCHPHDRMYDTREGCEICKTEGLLQWFENSLKEEKNNDKI